MLSFRGLSWWASLFFRGYITFLVKEIVIHVVSHCEAAVYLSTVLTWIRISYWQNLLKISPLALWGIAFCICEEVQNDACALVSPNMAPNRRRQRRSGQCLFLNTHLEISVRSFNLRKRNSRIWDPENYDEKYTVGTQEIPALFRQGPSKSHVTLGQAWHTDSLPLTIVTFWPFSPPKLRWTICLSKIVVEGISE